MMRTLLALLGITVAGWAQSTLGPPRLGFIQDHDAVRPLNGIAGNFLPGKAAATGIVSAAFSGSFGFLKWDAALAVIDKQGHQILKVSAPTGAALFAFSENGSPALAYFEHDASLQVWDGHRFQRAELNAAALRAQPVLAIAAPDSKLATFIVQREDGLWELGIRLATGAVVSQTALSGVIAPMLPLATGDLVYRDAHGVVMRHRDGSEKHIAAHLPKNTAFSQMAEGWVQVTDLATGRLSAVNVEPGRERYYVLPEARP